MQIAQPAGKKHDGLILRLQRASLIECLQQSNEQFIHRLILKFIFNSRPLCVHQFKTRTDTSLDRQNEKKRTIPTSHRCSFCISSRSETRSSRPCSPTSSSSPSTSARLRIVGGSSASRSATSGCWSATSTQSIRAPSPATPLPLA